MPVVHDADPWVRPPLGGRENTWRYGVVREGPGPQADLSFADLVDILNPFQHVPLISSLYRAVTGDEIQPAAKIMGATLYGGPIGFAAATNLAIVQEAAGDSPGDLLIAALMDGDETQDLQNVAQLDGAQLDGAQLDAARLDAAQLDAAQLDGAQLDAAQLDGAEDMPLPASGEAAEAASAQTERGPWPLTRWSERGPLVESTGWRQDWQSRARDTAPNTAADAAAAAAQVAAAGPERRGLGTAAAALETRGDERAGPPDESGASAATFLPFRRVT